MRSKSNMKNIILILTLNIVFLSSMWNCDKFDEMCEEYPQLIKNLFKPQFNENDIITTKIIPPTNDDIKDIKKGLWALFEITLVDNIDTEIDMNSKEGLLRGIVNIHFLHNTRFISLFKNNNNHNKVYLFVSDIRTTFDNKDEPISLFKKCNNIKGINVVICFDSPKKLKQGNCINFLFSGSENLEKVSLENLNLNCLYSTGLFNNCEKLEEIRFQKFNGDKKNSNWLQYIFSGFTRNNDEIPIKISCTGHFLYLFIAQWEYMYDKGKSFWEEEGKKFYIHEHKDELKNSDCYLDFTLYFKRKHNE